MITRGAEPFEFGEGSSGILFIHGWTSSPREMRFLAQSLQNRYRCKGILLRGHGQTPEDLEDTNWQCHVNQIREALAQLRSDAKSIFLIGLSYGAILALHTAFEENVEGLILLSPFTRSSKRILGVIHESSLIKYLPSFVMSINKKNNKPVNDPAQCEKHIRYPVMPLKPMKSLMDCVDKAHSILPAITNPVLFMHSTRDKTADYHGSVKFFERMGSRDKTFIPLEKSNHIITIDYDRPRVEKEAGSWLDKRCLTGMKNI